jgi:hypothetical protein
MADCFIVVDFGREAAREWLALRLRPIWLTPFIKQ